MIEIDPVQSVQLVSFLQDFSRVLFFYLNIFVFFKILRLTMDFINYWKNRNAN